MEAGDSVQGSESRVEPTCWAFEALLNQGIGLEPRRLPRVFAVPTRQAIARWLLALCGGAGG